MNRFLFHSDAVRLFRDKVYNNIYTIWDIRGDEKEIKEVTDSESITHRGFEIKDQQTKRTLFLPSKHVDSMPIKIHDTTPVSYGRKVYHVVKKCNSVKIYANGDMSMREFVDSWFDLEHTSPEDLLLCKLLVVTAATNRSYFRICTGAGFGKDGVVNNLIEITGKGKNISTASPAKLFQLIDDGFTMFNELSGFGGEKLSTFQQFFLTTGEMGTNVYQHGTTGSDKTRSSADISDYGWIMAHNDPEYYISKGKPVFEQMFTSAVFNRVFPVYLRGTVADKHDFMSADKNFSKLVEEGMQDYKAWIGKFNWLKENMKKTKCKYQVKDYDFSVPGTDLGAARFWNNMNKLAITVSEYAKDEEEFHKIMDAVYERHKDYIKRITDLGFMYQG